MHARSSYYLATGLDARARAVPRRLHAALIAAAKAADPAGTQLPARRGIAVHTDPLTAVRGAGVWPVAVFRVTPTGTTERAGLPTSAREGVLEESIPVHTVFGPMGARGALGAAYGLQPLDRSELDPDGLFDPVQARVRQPQQLLDAEFGVVELAPAVRASRGLPLAARLGSAATASGGRGTVVGATVVADLLPRHQLARIHAAAAPHLFTADQADGGHT